MSRLIIATGALAGLIAAVTAAGAFAAETPRPFVLAQATMPQPGSSEEELKNLTDQVVNSLSALQGGETEQKSAPAGYEGLMNALAGLVDKALKEGKSSDDVLKMIEEAIKKQDGVSLDELLARSGAKLDMRELLDRLVARAAAKGAQGAPKDEFTKMLEAEGRKTSLAGAQAKSARGKGGRTITIQKGDTLGSIARKYYGDGGMWRKIYQANRDILSNPDIIPAGRKLRLP